MKLATLGACVLLSCNLGSAAAGEFAIKVKSGASTQVHVYKSWKNDCTANVGEVKLVAKPAHGKLKTSAIQTTINGSRYNASATAHCVSKPIPGFSVDYKSDAGFRGSDSFLIQATWGTSRTEIDHYTVEVE